MNTAQRAAVKVVSDMLTALGCKKRKKIYCGKGCGEFAFDFTFADGSVFRLHRTGGLFADGTVYRIGVTENPKEHGAWDWPRNTVKGVATVEIEIELLQRFEHTEAHLAFDALAAQFKSEVISGKNKEEHTSWFYVAQTFQTTLTQTA